MIGVGVGVRDGRRGVALGIGIEGVAVSVDATVADGSTSRVGAICGTARSRLTAVGTGGRVGGTGTAVADASSVGGDVGSAAGEVGAAATVGVASTAVALGSCASTEVTLNDVSQSPKVTLAIKPARQHGEGASRMLGAYNSDER